MCYKINHQVSSLSTIIIKYQPSLPAHNTKDSNDDVIVMVVITDVIMVTKVVISSSKTVQSDRRVERKMRVVVRGGGEGGGRGCSGMSSGSVKVLIVWVVVA